MGKRDSVIDLVTALVYVGAAWYLSADRPDILPAFWYHANRLCGRAYEYTLNQYRHSIRGIV